jgi:hypothetical protein
MRQNCASSSTSAGRHWKSSCVNFRRASQLFVNSGDFGTASEDGAKRVELQQLLAEREMFAV